MTCLSFAAAPAWSAGKAHEHGALKLDVAIEGNKLTIAMEAPLDNLLGFERAPRTDAERKAAAEVLARLRSPNQGKALFSADASAQCTLSKADVQAPVLEPGAKPAPKDEHADLDASYEFSCAQPAELRSLDVGLFDAYKRIQRIDVQVAGPKSQSKVTLKRPARSVKLVR
ncbi:MAG: DUF2796 domain-containing protein [Burkholderiales bacterium]|jgi:hypothetical protein|nr:DUF2796 domain-containing protein [Burkholderiales bacterium]MCA3229089.1 DUF2796 domain-containing protein [Burkholderiales bacterium]